MSNADYYAHSGRNPDRSDWQKLKDHLLGVARLARQFADRARPGDEPFAHAAEVAGLLHDLGKYRREFQEMLDPRIRRPKSESTRHKLAGAAHAYFELARRVDLAFAIAGHHAGLPNLADLRGGLESDGGLPCAQRVWKDAAADCQKLGHIHLDPPPKLDRLQWEPLIRLLFSCLVDSDWLDTAGHAACAPLPVASELRPARLLDHLLGWISQKQCPEPFLKQIRSQVLDAALAAGADAPTTGLFSMTVPTGGGKTLSSLAFALRHAVRHGLRRIIYVAPFLSIIEQNAAVIRQAIGADDVDGIVLEHHSLSDPEGPAEEEGDTAHRLAENWDAPIVITTSVQFFESLFSHKPGRCRKLHNIARSVVILDECQTLPPDLIAATCDMLKAICATAGCSIVLCTATQPAWHHRDDLPDGLRDVREIVPPHLDLFNRLRRVNVAWPRRDESPWNWQMVADRMLERERALSVVNTKQAARDLFAMLREQRPGDVLHLSTLMCPAHRLIVLKEVRRRLAENLPCLLVSTQLIEAGVDVDFPLLLREMAPLDAIVQAAGRCNREGRLKSPAGGPGGQVIVFESVESKLPMDAWYRNGTDILRSQLEAGNDVDISDPRCLRRYFERLYRSGDLDARKIQALRQSFAFTDVSNAYRLIDNLTTSVVCLNWLPMKERIAELLAEMENHPAPRLRRELERYSVNLFPEDLRKRSALIARSKQGISLCGARYSNDVGLTADVLPSDWVQ